MNTADAPASTRTLSLIADPSVSSFFLIEYRRLHLLTNCSLWIIVT